MEGKVEETRDRREGKRGRGTERKGREGRGMKAIWLGGETHPRLH